MVLLIHHLADIMSETIIEKIVYMQKDVIDGQRDLMRMYRDSMVEMANGTIGISLYTYLLMYIYTSFIILILVCSDAPHTLLDNY
jgi:hypothetical protein